MAAGGLLAVRLIRPLAFDRDALLDQLGGQDATRERDAEEYSTANC